MISELNEIESIREQQANLRKDSQAKELKHVHETCQIKEHAQKKHEILKTKYKTEINLIET